MSTKEDILEQLVEEYLLHEGYFVQHNIKFRPSEHHIDFVKKSDSNHSDIDVIGIHPRLSGPRRVVVVSCKSWQRGFNPKAEIEAIEKNKIISGRERWKPFRELVSPKWSEAFIQKIDEVAGTKEFTYIIAVTKTNGDNSVWKENSKFRQSIGGNSIEVLDMRSLLAAVLPKLTTTVANTSIGRMLQLIKASGVEIKL